MYPIFITDRPDAEEDIPSLPLQKRLIAQYKNAHSSDGVLIRSLASFVLLSKRGFDPLFFLEYQWSRKRIVWAL
jgi:hypothetical protein